MKGPEYVAVTTLAYRQAVDAAWEQITLQGPVSDASSSGPAQLVTDQHRKALHQVHYAVLARNGMALDVLIDSFTRPLLGSLLVLLL